MAQTTSAKEAPIDTIEPDIHSERALGFWLYPMSDAVIFALLFATYIVMTPGTAGGPSGAGVFDIRTTFTETIVLLASTFTFGLASLAVARGASRDAIGWLAVTFLLGAVFVIMEIAEFNRMLAAGAGPDRSGFLSAFFILVGTHGVHVTAGLYWIGVSIVQIASKGLGDATISRITRLGWFWHFLDLVWIGIYSIVYLPGVM